MYICREREGEMICVYIYIYIYIYSGTHGPPLLVAYIILCVSMLYMSKREQVEKERKRKRERCVHHPCTAYLSKQVCIYSCTSEQVWGNKYVTCTAHVPKHGEHNHCCLNSMTVFSVHGGSFSRMGFGRYQINLHERATR